jgi:hypothetical protein
VLSFSLDCMIFTSSWACSTAMEFLRRFTDDMALLSAQPEMLDNRQSNAKWLETYG